MVVWPGLVQAEFPLPSLFPLQYLFRVRTLFDGVRMKRFLWLGLILFLFLICVACGDTYRPVIIPNPPAFPDPRASHSVMTVNDNGTDKGSNTIINVSGDSVTGVADMGLTPVHAVQQTASQALVVNHGALGEMADSVTKVTFFGTEVSSATTISLPPNSAPTFIAVAPTDTKAYVTLPALVPDPINNPGVVVPSVGVIDTSANRLLATVAAGVTPTAIVVTPDRNKFYVADSGSNVVTNFNTLDRSPRNGPPSSPLTLAAPSIWLLSRNDAQRVYVLETNGTVATIDTTSTAGPDAVIDSSVSVPNATYMLYDGHLNRLYIPATDPGDGHPELVVLDVSPSVPQVLARVALPAAGVAVAALPDGSRTYAASNGDEKTTTIGTISSVSGDGSFATYTFDPESVTGSAPQLGMTLTISSDANDGFDGTFIVVAVAAGTFEVANSTHADSTDARSATGINFLPQVTVINNSGNVIKTTIAMPAVPAEGLFEPAICTAATTRFRFNMAAGGDSSRIYMASCDAGNISVIDTSTDTYIASLTAPVSSRPPVPPNSQPPPQNPVFMIAGP